MPQSPDSKDQSKKGRIPKHTKLNTISQRYVEDHELRDTPARLFRGLLNKLKMTPYLWNKYLREYLEWVVTTEDEEKARVERTTRGGNIKDTYFQKPTLTFNKLLEGLSILRMDKCRIEITVTDLDGNTFTVAEDIQIMGKDRLATPFSLENEND